MNEEKKIRLRFDRLTYMVSYKAIKGLIINELNRLSAETNYSIKNIPIYFKEKNRGNAVAYFRHQGNKPISFTFCLDTFENASANEIIDTCRHEFAHFMVCLENVGNLPKNAHGTKWAAACRRVGARPDTHIHKELTRHFVG